jgi:hypothetical protein
MLGDGPTITLAELRMIQMLGQSGSHSIFRSDLLDGGGGGGGGGSGGGRSGGGGGAADEVELVDFANLSDGDDGADGTDSSGWETCSDAGDGSSDAEEGGDNSGYSDSANGAVWDGAAVAAAGGATAVPLAMHEAAMLEEWEPAATVERASVGSQHELAGEGVGEGVGERAGEDCNDGTCEGAGEDTHHSP